MTNDQLLSKWWFTDYSDDILGTLRKKEMTLCPFYAQSPQFEYRSCLVDLICSVAEAEDLSRTTVHLGVYLMDIFMDNHNIIAERLKLIALSSLILASKIEERESNVLKITEVNMMVNNSYPLNDYRYMEVLILRFMDWNLLVPTAAQFIEFFVSEMITDEDLVSTSLVIDDSNINNKMSQAIFLAFQFLEVALYDCVIMHKTPSKVAASCIAATRIYMQLLIPWPDHLVTLTSFELDDLYCIVEMLIDRKETLSLRINTDSGYLSGG